MYIAVPCFPCVQFHEAALADLLSDESSFQAYSKTIFAV